ncbi:uncharacterized protein LAJ45_05904 [Morchella importuna]|uniref:uncharacterized protein n=1 Tax=Morchella importuna TaxID=1174673 RepID=UPI001E8CF68B|nr:uncharacterized protein LAJ45_05904 [Morchella importuna]KAH8150218.1 hypothetical protein LAJ45_05904 [Morchella importuna]
MSSLIPIAHLERFRETAASLIPQLIERREAPKSIIRFDPCATTYLRYKPSSLFPVEELESRLWGKGDEFIIDFESHRTGYFSFDLAGEGDSVGDAPTRLRLVFGEVPGDVVETLDPAKSKSWISTSWYPDEIINIDECPSSVNLPRRFAFRYVRVQVLCGSKSYKIRFLNVKATAISSTASLPPPYQTADDLLRRIDQTSVITLRDCMTTIFEDGPRRDRRLWLGDLRLQALANYYTFKNYDLVKRCLYLFAGFPREDGSVPAAIFERPVTRRAGDYILDYDVLFGVTVLDYVEASGDKATGHDLWQTVVNSTRNSVSSISADGRFTPNKNVWVFLDWQDGLDRTTGAHALIVFALKAVNQLASLLGYPAIHTDVITASSETLSSAFDAEKGVFVSGPKRQVSWASQAWIALADIVPPERAKVALVNAYNDPSATKAMTPYLFHYVTEAFARVGAKEEAMSLLLNYWGGMVQNGADTFWEAYDPADSMFSPYGDHLNNSYCHAWSCTPAYLLRSGLIPTGN